jgi:hypothetical protein
MFNQELTPPEPRPNLILFDLLHCYKKFIHAAGDHHWSRQNTRLVRTPIILFACFEDTLSFPIHPRHAEERKQDERAHNKLSIYDSAGSQLEGGRMWVGNVNVMESAVYAGNVEQMWNARSE